MSNIILKLSALLSRGERALVVAFTGLLVLIITINMVTRAVGWSQYWADEAAIQTMVIASFAGASQMARQRADFSVTTLLEVLPQPLVRILLMLVRLICLTLCVFLLWLAWRWFDPVALARAGFDLGAFAAATQNFVYMEQTQTLGIAKFWFYLILPWFALSMIVHGAANLIEVAQGKAAGESAVRAPSDADVALS
ncbi:MAG TPA: TRAP transporter small permease [Vineibacter sp.]|nr:TRAP transporter small permease [Vineibacter sp.]